MDYNKTVITQEQFEMLMYSNISYEGFVAGLGYVLPEVVVVSSPVNEYYTEPLVTNNLSYNVLLFAENVETVGNFVGNTSKGFYFGLNQRYQVAQSHWIQGAPVTGIIDTHAGRLKNGKPVGDWAVRVDLAHKGAQSPHPHININPKLSGIPDPHTTINMKTLKGLEVAGKTFNVVGKIAKPVAIVTDGARITSAFAEDGGTVGKNTVVTSAEVAGGWAGAWAGAKLGGMGGAAVGSFFPGAGTAIGGFVGAVGGGIAGAFGGSWLAKEGSTAAYEMSQD